MGWFLGVVVPGAGSADGRYDGAVSRAVAFDEAACGDVAVDSAERRVGSVWCDERGARWVPGGCCAAAEHAYAEGVVG